MDSCMRSPQVISESRCTKRQLSLHLWMPACDTHTWLNCLRSWGWKCWPVKHRMTIWSIKKRSWLQSWIQFLMIAESQASAWKNHIIIPVSVSHDVKRGHTSKLDVGVVNDVKTGLAIDSCQLIAWYVKNVSYITWIINERKEEWIINKRKQGIF